MIETSHPGRFRSGKAFAVLIVSLLFGGVGIFCLILVFRFRAREPIRALMTVSGVVAGLFVPFYFLFRSIGVHARRKYEIPHAESKEDKTHLTNEDLERRVAERTVELTTALKELDAFTYSVSHDLRAPLRHIDGFIELLHKRIVFQCDDESRRYMYVIAEAAKGMGVLIDSLLAFSKTSRMEIKKEPVRLNEMVDEIRRELKGGMENRRINWSVGELPVVSADPLTLRLVMTNLLQNAVKFTRNRETAEIEVGSHDKSPGETTVFVRDNGVGFDMKYVDKLFGVFQRLHRTEEFEGTGIGLANVRRHITRLGGRTWAEGAVDVGATFFFTLPNS